MYEDDIKRLAGLFDSREPISPPPTPDEEFNDLLSWIERTQQQLKNSDDFGVTSAAWELRRFADQVRACRRTPTSARQMQFRFYGLLASNVLLRDAQLAAVDEWMRQDLEKRIRELEELSEQRCLSKEEAEHLHNLRKLRRNESDTP